MRKASAPGPLHFGGVRPLQKQSSFDLSPRKISIVQPPLRQRESFIVVPDPKRRISAPPPPPPPPSSRGLLALHQNHTSSFDASEFRRAYIESHFNENEVTISQPARCRKPPFFGPSTEASSKFRKKLRTKAEGEQLKLQEGLGRLGLEAHQLQAQTEDCLGGDEPEVLRSFCLTTFKILTTVNDCYEIVKSIQASGGGNPGSSNTIHPSSGLQFQSSNLLSESFRNHDFAKDISVSYFGLNWNELWSLIGSMESQAGSLQAPASRKNSLDHYYGGGSGGNSGSSELSESGCLQTTCVTICKDLRKVRDDVLSHTEAVLRGRLSPVNKQIISEEQNRFRAYSVINSLLSHSQQPLERKGSFTNKLMSLFHPSKKKQHQTPPSNNTDNVWSEWFEVALNQRQLLRRIQEI